MSRNCDCEEPNGRWVSTPTTNIKFVCYQCELPITPERQALLKRIRTECEHCGKLLPAGSNIAHFNCPIWALKDRVEALELRVKELDKLMTDVLKYARIPVGGHFLGSRPR